MNDYVILTDAAADHADIMSSFPDIIPMQITMDGEEFLYGCGGITCEEFYTRQRNGSHARTSLITPSVYYTYFEKYLSQGLDIFYLCFSSGMSGTFQSAVMAADDIAGRYPERRIICVDTKNGSTPQGFLAREAMRRKLQGCPMEELASWAEQQCLRIGVCFTVDVLEHLVAGGRLNPAAAKIGTALHIKPFLTIDADGRLKVIGAPRGTKAAMNAMIQKMSREWTPDISNYVLICHGDDPAKAETLRRHVQDAFPEAEIEVGQVGAVIGTHTGPGMISLCYWGKQR
ncbi:MAG: DegV family protein [Solobacterium sp.]|nr:DegV family protein [Solobacterium sp.]